MQCDICCASDVAALMEAMAAARTGSIRAVMHIGGMLQDATLPSQSAKSLRAVFAPKVQVNKMSALPHSISCRDLALSFLRF